MRLGRFHGLVACGGFSYGDVLGAGEGWAKSILFNRARARRVRGVSSRATRPSRWACATAARCSSALKELIPGAGGLAAIRAQPLRAVRGAAGAGARAALGSVLLAGMHGSVLPIAVAHGEGQAEFDSGASADELLDAGVW